MRRARITSGEGATRQAVLDLLNKFDYPVDRAPSSNPLVGGGGGMAHVLIVSDSEPVQIQAKADFVVPSTNSSTQLQTVFDTIEAQQGNQGAWSIWMAGIFNLDADVTAPDQAWIRGLGFYEASGCSS